VSKIKKMAGAFMVLVDRELGEEEFWQIFKKR
jgi:hypothetical protein